jgi:hypothetical protein
LVRGVIKYKTSIQLRHGAIIVGKATIFMESFEGV